MTLNADLNFRIRRSDLNFWANKEIKSLTPLHNTVNQIEVIYLQPRLVKDWLAIPAFMIRELDSCELLGYQKGVIILNVHVYIIFLRRRKDR